MHFSMNGLVHDTLSVVEFVLPVHIVHTSNVDSRGSLSTKELVAPDVNPHMAICFVGIEKYHVPGFQRGSADFCPRR